MRISTLIGLAAAALVVGTSPPLVANERDLADCSDVDSISIAACTRVIEGKGETAADRAQAHFFRGMKYAEDKEFDRAIADYSESIKLNPKKASFPYALRGEMYGKKGDFDRAVADLNEAIRLAPKFATNYALRGDMYHAKGDEDRAIAEYTQAIRLDPKDSKHFTNRGNAYGVKGDLAHAIADFTEAIRLDPKDPLAYNNRGGRYFDKGDLDRSIADFTAAIRVSPRFATAYYNRGGAYRAKGDNDHAIADLTEAIRLNPKFTIAYLRRGITYLGSDSLGNAMSDPSEADIIQAAEIDPKNAYAALWNDIIGQRNNGKSSLVQAASKIDMTKWPAPLIRLFLGQTTADAVVASADDPNPTTKSEQMCEANFYSGEFALRQGAKDEAIRLFRLAASGCRKMFDEWAAANTELKALGASR
jgi:tetratricopeptide (TPR) repeat protein